MPLAVLIFILTFRVAVGQVKLIINKKIKHVFHKYEMITRLLNHSYVLLQWYDGVANITKDLDMANKSVDDQYLGCKEYTAHLVEIYLEQELTRPEKLSKFWEDIKNKCSSDDAGNTLRKNHCIALYVYTYDAFTQPIYQRLNTDTYKGIEKYTSGDYQWYFLHFFLTDAIQRLNKIQNYCNLTYRRTRDEYIVKSKLMRFGFFTSSSTNKTAAEEFGDVSCFEISTCHGASIKNYSNKPEQEEVLIPPYETFKITNVLYKKDNSSLWCNTVYVLRSIGVESKLTCDLSNRTIATVGITIAVICYLIFCLFLGWNLASLRR